MDESLNTQLQEASSTTELNQVIKIFNASMLKRNIIRTEKFSDLQDKLLDQLQERIETKPGNFSDDMLLKMVTSIQTIIDKNSVSSLTETPQIAIQQNNNITIQSDLGTLDKDSRDKVRDVIKLLLKEQQEDVEVVSEQQEVVQLQEEQTLSDESKQKVLEAIQMMQKEGEQSGFGEVERNQGRLEG